VAVIQNELLDWMVQKLQKAPTGSLAASQLCADAKKNPKWGETFDNAGGFKDFCLDHDDKITFVKDGGGGKVELVKSASIPVGAKVRITSENPAYGWGLARPWSIGTVRSFSGSTYVVDFPGAENWKGKEADLAITDNRRSLHAGYWHQGSCI
jgi:hypothetical protein